MNALVKDPLQTGETPFEILAVGPDADPEEVERAFKRVLPHARGGPARAMEARRILKDPAKRELARIFLYDARVAARLDPSPLTEPTSLSPERRSSTASAWESALALRFPDLELAHSLAILWYWAAIRAEPLPNGGADLAVPTIWRWAIGYWAMLATSGALQPAVRQLVVDRLRDDLNRTAERLDTVDAGAARRCRALQDTLASELASARAVAEAHVTLAHAQVFGGRLLLEHLGVLETVRGKSKGLDAVLSPHAEIEGLLAAGKPDAALSAITRLARTPATDDLAARARTLRAAQHASVGAFADAFECLRRAAESGRSQEVRASTRREIVGTCLAHAGARREADRDEAIGILERGVELAEGDPSLEIALAEALCERGIERMNDAQSSFDPQSGDMSRLRGGLDRGLEDLERAGALGSQKAQDQLPLARQIVEQAALTQDPELERRLARAAEHAQRGDWDAAISALEALLQTAGSRPGAMQDELRRSLAVSRHNRAMDVVSRAMASPGDRDSVLEQLGAARRDLQVAATLDPTDSDYPDGVARVDELAGAITSGGRSAPAAGHRRPGVVAAAVLLLVCAAVGAAVDPSKGAGAGFAVWCVILFLWWQF